MALHKYLYKIIDNYFNSLSILGRVSNEKLNTIVLLDFIVFILEDKDIILEEQVYKDLYHSLLSFLGRDCYIPYPEYISNKNINKASLSTINIRSTTSNNIRSIDSNLRKI